MKKIEKTYASRVYIACSIILLIGLYFAFVEVITFLALLLIVMSSITMISFKLYQNEVSTKSVIREGFYYTLEKIKPSEKVAIISYYSFGHLMTFPVNLDLFLTGLAVSQEGSKFMAGRVKSKQNKILLLSV